MCDRISSYIFGPNVYANTFLPIRSYAPDLYLLVDTFHLMTLLAICMLECLVAINILYCIAYI